MFQTCVWLFVSMEQNSRIFMQLLAQNSKDEKKSTKNENKIFNQ